MSFMLYVLPYGASSSFWTWAAPCAAETRSWRQRTLEVRRTQTASTRPSKCLWPSHRTPRSQREWLRWGGFFTQMPFCLPFYMLLPRSLKGVDQAMIQFTSALGYQNLAHLTRMCYLATETSPGLLSSNNSTLFNLSRSWLWWFICKENNNPIWPHQKSFITGKFITVIEVWWSSE